MFSNNKIIAMCIAAVALSSHVQAEKQVAETFGLLSVPGVGVGVPGVASVGVGGPGYVGPGVGVGVLGVASVGVGVGVPGVGVGVNGVGVGVNGVGVGVGVPGVASVGVGASPVVGVNGVHAGAPATVIHDGVDVGVGTGASKTVTVTSDDGASTAKTSTGTGAVNRKIHASFSWIDTLYRKFQIDKNQIAKKFEDYQRPTNVADFVAEVGVDPALGLSRDDAMTRRALYGANRVTPPVNCPSWVCCLLPCLMRTASMQAYQGALPREATVRRRVDAAPGQPASRRMRMDAMSLVYGDVVGTQGWGTWQARDLRVGECSDDCVVDQETLLGDDGVDEEAGQGRQQETRHD
ncbi:carbohydrate-binding protein, putative [Phytophthora infestans T30-4]|uniref:Carbohydrate-binding protein, putative n=1 Tax=Phytophthora infestans (strain T30-4) TaxID=403677 RepID=D0P155_PHYIT|nr:carbohydrate-binding protein, putative [Phytophthora infestans T30-4]EEY54075.1 carbohydrate-binding protein, putative [Phytophthora infestans T30-4]|eukprot:XP_002895976.1 carbohydrate-binding protein, putative [Phytophthora infestans T30-4]